MSIREEYFAREFVKEALEKMNSRDIVGNGWNCFFVESPVRISWAIDPYKSVKITYDDHMYYFDL